MPSRSCRRTRHQSGGHAGATGPVDPERHRRGLDVGGQGVDGGGGNRSPNPTSVVGADVMARPAAGATVVVPPVADTVSPAATRATRTQAVAPPMIQPEPCPGVRTRPAPVTATAPGAAPRPPRRDGATVGRRGRSSPGTGRPRRHPPSRRRDPAPEPPDPLGPLHEVTDGGLPRVGRLGPRAARWHGHPPAANPPTPHGRPTMHGWPGTSRSTSARPTPSFSPGARGSS